MARFRATCKGDRGEASRIGSKMEASINSWNVGVKIYAFKDDNDIDTIHIWKTGGSNNPDKAVLIAAVSGSSTEF